MVKPGMGFGILLGLLLGPGPAFGAVPPTPSEVIEKARFLRRTDQDAAFRAVEQAIQSLGPGDGSGDHCDLLILAADLSLARAHYAGSITYAERALALARQLGDPPREGRALRQMGRAQRNQGLYPLALQSFDSAERHLEGPGQEVERALCVEDRALVLRRLGELTRALEDLQRVRDVLERLGQPEHRAQVINNIGLLQLELGMTERAMATFQEGLRLAEKEQVRGTLAILLENMADLHIKQGRYEEARPLLDRALELQRTEKRWKNYGTTLQTLGQLFIRKGEFDRADKVLRESLRVKEEIGESYGIISTLIQLGINHAKAGRTEWAIQDLDRAVRISHETGTMVLEAEAQRVLSGVHKKAGRPTEALAAFERHVELLARIHSEENRNRLVVLQSRLELQRHEQEILFLKRIQAEREADLHRAHRLRNVILGVTALAVLLAAALYTRFRHGRRLLKALGESEARFRALAEQAPVGAWIVQDGLVQYANREVAGFFATTPEQLLGADPSTLILAQEAATAEGPAWAETVDPEGKVRHLECYAGALDLQGREATLEVFIDVSRRREVERELARYQESLVDLVAERTGELEEAHRELLMRERLSILGRLTATVAHELRNPMGAIRSSLFTLGQGLPAEVQPLARKALGLAERSILRCEGLVQELLSYSSSRPLQLQPTDLGAWIQEVLDDHPFPEEVDLECRFAAVPPVAVDRERLRRAMVNLLENAVHAILSGPRGRGTVQVGLALHEGHVRIQLADDGMGIREEHQKRVFEPLFSTKSFGSGLGLAVVREVVEGHGGDVHLESTEGRGTCVFVDLPLGE